MPRLEEPEFLGDRALVAHTGMRRFSRAVCWRASDAEEGLLLGDDGCVRAVMPGETVWPGRMLSGRGDLFAFRRGSRLSGVVGAGGVAGRDGICRGGYGGFECSLLLPRRLLDCAAQAFADDAPLSAVAADRMRPALLSAMEQVSARFDDPAKMRAEIARTAFPDMRAALIRCGLLLVRFDLARFDRVGAD